MTHRPTDGPAAPGEDPAPEPGQPIPEQTPEPTSAPQPGQPVPQSRAARAAAATPPAGVGAKTLAVVKEVGIVVGLAMILSLLIKTFLLQAFWIPSGSMEDTLVRDDRVVVTKLVPGPFQLSRGDIVVFEDPGTDGNKWLRSLPAVAPSTTGGPLHSLLVFVGLIPEDSENHLIKRVIGLPGDHVVSDGGSGPLTINGVTVDESAYLKPGNAASEGKPFDIVVPADSVWVMGDHRSDSSDSRYHQDDGHGGCVPMDKIVGRALVVLWPVDHLTWLGGAGGAFDKVPTASSTPAAVTAPPRAQ